jgi:hypothetical protein
MMDLVEKRREDCMPPFASLEARTDEPPRYYDASLMLRRMALSEIDRAELAESDPLLFRELQGVCALCERKARCALDLAKQASGDRSEEWRDYCPNAAALAALGMEQNCGLAGRHGAGEELVVPTKLGRVILRRRAHKRTYLERRPEESRFGPRQYFYPASKSGVVPAGNDRPTNSPAR